MLYLLALAGRLGSARPTLDCTLDRLLVAIVVFLDLGVVSRLPVDEHADVNEEIVGFVTLQSYRRRRCPATALATAC